MPNPINVFVLSFARNFVTLLLTMVVSSAFFMAVKRCQRL